MAAVLGSVVHTLNGRRGFALATQ